MTARKWFACLIGNGLSIAYNADLSIPKLTGALFDEFRRLGGDEASDALSSFAEATARARGKHDFEALLSPLEAVAGALPHLENDHRLRS